METPNFLSWGTEFGEGPGDHYRALGEGGAVPCANFERLQGPSGGRSIFLPGPRPVARCSLEWRRLIQEHHKGLSRWVHVPELPSTEGGGGHGSDGNLSGSSFFSQSGMVGSVLQMWLVGTLGQG